MKRKEFREVRKQRKVINIYNTEKEIWFCLIDEIERNADKLRNRKKEIQEESQRKKEADGVKEIFCHIQVQ